MPAVMISASSAKHGHFCALAEPLARLAASSASEASPIVLSNPGDSEGFEHTQQGVRLIRVQARNSAHGSGLALGAKSVF